MVRCPLGCPKSEPQGPFRAPKGSVLADFGFFSSKRVISYTGARSTKIANLLFFELHPRKSWICCFPPHPKAHAGLPRVFRCFEKVIFLDFEVRNDVKPVVFVVSPLENTKKRDSWTFPRNFKKKAHLGPKREPKRGRKSTKTVPKTHRKLRSKIDRSKKDPRGPPGVHANH